MIKSVGVARGGFRAGVPNVRYAECCVRDKWFGVPKGGGGGVAAVPNAKVRNAEIRRISCTYSIED